MHTLESIRDFLRLNENLATSGMPGPDHFAAMRRAGFEAVINLAMPTSDHALPNEGELVSAQGMTYVHIPVKFESPTRADFERFVRVMKAFETQRVFVHCAANMRVSAFVFLLRLHGGAVDRAQAERDLKAVWEPDGIWLELINARLAEWGMPALK
jgi:protein tyrosine phosphatase (PTP) superfamily phosphohydrolase (DUF442 family)